MGIFNGWDWFLIVYNFFGVYFKKGKRGGIYWYLVLWLFGVCKRDFVLRENSVYIGIFLVWLMISMCYNKVYR